MSFLNKPSAPSPTPSNASSTGTKRKRPAADTTPVYSQPRETGTGVHAFTQYTYAIEYLRGHDQWKPFQDITNYLNVRKEDASARATLQALFQGSAQQRIEWNGERGAKALYRYKPKYGIRNAEELMGYLQAQKSGLGLSVRDLKDGWPACQDTIASMEKRKELLVTHNKKDGTPRTVWGNDATLMYSVDTDVVEGWHSISIPANPEELRKKLVSAGLKPASAPRIIAPSKKQEKKQRRAPRRNGKTTNTHMVGMLKDYSQKKK